MRTLLERRELAEAELVQDLSRLGVAERVVARVAWKSASDVSVACASSGTKGSAW